MCVRTHVPTCACMCVCGGGEGGGGEGGGKVQRQEEGRKGSSARACKLRHRTIRSLRTDHLSPVLALIIKRKSSQSSECLDEGDGSDRHFTDTETSPTELHFISSAVSVAPTPVFEGLFWFLPFGASVSILLVILCSKGC